MSGFLAVGVEERGATGAAHRADSRKRWDTDDRFTGVADASAFAPPWRSWPRWPAARAGSPKTSQIHLVPHLRGARVDGVRIVQTAPGLHGFGPASVPGQPRPAKGGAGGSPHQPRRNAAA